MTSSSSPPSRRVLLVDDSAADVYAINIAFARHLPHVTLTVAVDGDEALRVLRSYSDSDSRPHLVILDLNLPGRTGLEVLQEMKSDPSLRRLPVVVLSSSHSEDDIDSVYDQHGNCYVVKPNDLQDLFAFVRSLDAWWFGTTTLPRG